MFTVHAKEIMELYVINLHDFFCMDSHRTPWALSMVFYDSCEKQKPVNEEKKTLLLIYQLLKRLSKKFCINVFKSIPKYFRCVKLIKGKFRLFFTRNEARSKKISVIFVRENSLIVHAVERYMVLALEIGVATLMFTLKWECFRIIL